MRFRDRDGNEFIVEESQCPICELEALLKERDQELRRSLQRMNPITDPNYDPLFNKLADVDQEILSIRSALRITNDGHRESAGRTYLEEATELVKRLAWGPSEDSRPPKPVPLFDVTTRAGRMKKSMHTRWHVRAGKPCTCRPSPST